MAGLSAGDLDREILIQTATATQSDSGEQVVTWGSNEWVWAMWLPAGSTEAWKAQSRLEGIVDGVFRIHWRGDIDPATKRIVWDGKTYDVRPPVEGGRHEWLDIPVSAIA